MRYDRKGWRCASALFEQRAPHGLARATVFQSKGKGGHWSGTLKKWPRVGAKAALRSKDGAERNARGASPWTKSGLSKPATRNLCRASKVFDLPKACSVRCHEGLPGCDHGSIIIVMDMPHRGSGLPDCPTKPMEPDHGSTRNLASSFACTRQIMDLQGANRKPAVFGVMCAKEHRDRKTACKAALSNLFDIGLPSIDRLGF